MHINALVTLFALLVAVDADGRHARLAKRQAPSASGSSSSSSSASSSASSSQPSPPPAPAGPTSSAAAPAPSAPPSDTGSASASPVPTTPVGTSIPPLSQITSGMPTPTTLPVTATYAAGAIPPIPGAPVLPAPFVFIAADWPPQDQIAPTTGAEVAQWMQELKGYNIPNITPTADGSCVGDPAAAANASARGWWTCGGYTRPSDITACPNKMTWGVSFDDGPGFYTQELLDYLQSKNLTSTFFVVGSRVIERPQVLLEEYMSGHEIAVHTWSHRPLTMLTTEQVVAELGYTRKAIKQVLGVTPTLMRPPYGDIDDRVRAISLAMGMVPVIWTRTPSGATFDTNDWKVPGGVVSGPQSFATFEAILNNATILNTGFIVLEHDLYAQTVDLAIGYTLPAAMSFNPPITLDSIGHCNQIPATNLYRESNQNKTFPYTNTSYSSAPGGASGSSGAKTGASNAALNVAVTMSVVVAPLLALASLVSLL